MSTAISPSAVLVAQDLRSVVGRLRRRMREAVDLETFTPSQTSVLSRLSKNGDSSASALAAAERVRPQSMAATLAVLEEREMVVRRPDPDDGRRQIVSLSPAGRAFLDGTRRTGTEWLSAALDEHFTQAERQQLLVACALMERIADL